MPTVRITTSQNIDIDYQVASLSDRIGARVIDYMIFSCAYMAIMMIVLVFAGVTGDAASSEYMARNDGKSFVVLTIVWLVLCVFYDLLTEIFLNGQSIGKRSLKIRVISLSGARPSVSQYIQRWIFRIVDFGITMGTAAVVTTAFSDNKQRIGDMIAGTAVIRTSPRNKFEDLVFSPPPADYAPMYHQVLQLKDRDIVLIHEVIRNFNRTRNSNLVYMLAQRIKKYLNVSYPSEINEYQFLEIIVNDYNSLIAQSGI